MEIKASDVKRLRELTGAGMMDAKQALQEAGGDFDKALENLRKQGKKIAVKKAERQASEGLIGVYLHANGKVAVMVEVKCETDFVARTDKFKQLANDIAMQIAAMSPAYLSPEDVPEEVKEKEREIYRAEVEQQGKPAEIVEKIVEGKLNKFYSQVCLLKQQFIKDDSLTIEQLIEQNIAALGENIKIGKFVRFSL